MLPRPAPPPPSAKRGTDPPSVLPGLPKSGDANRVDVDKYVSLILWAMGSDAIAALELLLSTGGSSRHHVRNEGPVRSFVHHDYLFI